MNLPNSKHGAITGADMDAIVWVKPTLVAQIAFTEWTAGGLSRHPRFIASRARQDRPHGRWPAIKPTVLLSPSRFAIVEVMFYAPTFPTA